MIPRGASAGARIPHYVPPPQPVTFDPMAYGGPMSLSANLLTAYDLNEGPEEFATVRANALKTSGKWYWEIYIDACPSTLDLFIGVIRSDAFWWLRFVDTSNIPRYAYRSNGYLYDIGIGANIGAYTAGDVVMVAWDASADKIWFGLNGVWNGNPAAGTGEAASGQNTEGLPMAAGIGFDNNPGLAQVTARFAAESWGYAPPTGFAALTV